MKIVSIIGARPHFMKMTPLSRLFESVGVSHIVVHSGQHYDERLSGQFIKEFGIDAPDYNLKIGSGSPNYQIGQFLLSVDPILVKENPDLILVYGDTNTTAAGAIAAAKNNIPLGHVEAGLREWDKNIPEEVNKLITDSITDLYFCPTTSAVENLKKAGITDNVYLTGDITLDLLVKDTQYLSKEILMNRYGITSGNFIFFTCHRQNNCNNLQALGQIVAFLNECPRQTVWPVHPRTRNALETYGLKVNNPNIIQCQPIGYWDTQSLIRESSFVITDSGGVTKEAYFHKIKCIVIDTQTEWMEGMKEGWMKIAGPYKQSIQDALSQPFTMSKHTNAYGNGQAANKMHQIISYYLTSSGIS